MKDYSGLHSHMALRASGLLEPRKTPVQTRSTATVEAIFEATIQVLLREGPDRLTTTRVAERAGVSVGTLYQYYPNKHSLLFAVNERHLNHVLAAVERACIEQRHQPLGSMVNAVVQAFLDAKLERKDVSVALYGVTTESGAEAVAAKLTKRARNAMSAMLKTAPEARFPEIDFTVFTFLAAMAGATRAVLEAGASQKMVENLRTHLVLLGKSYLSSTAK
jgi:AcrR family transcriptional regulator